jgi:hypothetical protein
VLSAVDVEGVEVAAHTELPAGAPHDDQVLHHQRRDCGAFPRAHVSVDLGPDALPGDGVEREHAGVRGDDEDLPLGNGDPTVHVAAAQ